MAILDGLGIGGGGEDDAVATAHTPHLKWLAQHSAYRTLKAHGLAVGLPSDADMGNSEVGHNAMGAGRVFDQGARLVNDAFATGAAWSSPTWQRLRAGRTLHLLGLLSDGNVHSHVDHLYALLARAQVDGIQRLRLHLLTDGRDVSPRSALTWLEPLEACLKAHNDAGRDWAVASGGGRMFVTMDRYESDWSIVQRGWLAHVHGVGRTFPSATAAVRTFYAESTTGTDQDHPPFVIVNAAGEPTGRILDGDSVLLFNFRGDRAIQLSRCFEQEQLNAFDRGRRPNVFFAGMMQYDGDNRLPSHFLVAPPVIDGTVGELFVGAGLASFATAETQKFGHITYFFNGNRSAKLDDRLDQWQEIPSDRAPFEERPWMKAAEVTDAAIVAITSNRYQTVRLNLANCDMVGHTGALNSARLAVDAVDLCVGRLINAVRLARGVLVVTADHGNADQMWQRDKAGRPVCEPNGAPIPMTSHTLNPVPFAVVDSRGARTLRGDLPGAGIASVGSTLLALCGLQVPTGWEPSLLDPE